MIPHPLEGLLRRIHADLLNDRAGEVATYIPELAKADPERFGIVIATVEGAFHVHGDVEVPFTIQSMSKPFAYAAALDRFGRDGALVRVGVEPTGEAFNAIVLDEANKRPFNAMVNAGAIAVSALFEGRTADEKSAVMIETLSRFAGRPLLLDEAVWRSESETGHRNRAIAYLMLNSGMLAADPDTALDTYFRQCSLLVNVRDLALMAATLANSGVNPSTGVKAMERVHVPDLLSVMLTCGMYDYAGQWTYEVGLPAKSGVSGGIIAVVPGQFGIAAYSPRLDRYGNSVRAVGACRALSHALSLHSMAERARVSHESPNAVDRGLRSQKWRTRAETAVLDGAADRIASVDSRGVMTVAGAERLTRCGTDAHAAGREVILDLRRVTSLEPGAEWILNAFATAIERDRETFILLLSTTGADLGALPRSPGVVIADSLDHALEIAEDRILRSAAVVADMLPLAQAPFLAGLDPEALQALTRAVPPEAVRFAAGMTIVRKGAPSDAIYFVAAGLVSVRLPTAGRGFVRLGSLGPGATFGEMALLDGQARSADVVAERDSVCWALPTEPLREFLERNPTIMNRVLIGLVGDLSNRLRRLNQSVALLST